MNADVTALRTRARRAETYSGDIMSRRLTVTEMLAPAEGVQADAGGKLSNDPTHIHRPAAALKE